MWNDVRWQRRNTVRDVEAMRKVFGRHLCAELAEGIIEDQAKMATMSLAMPPHVLNVMDEHDLWGDPIRRYMAPALKERHPRWATHPFARRDSLAEASSWAVEGLVHRYSTKVMVELVTSCPQYCGHCTRMDLIGPSTPSFTKRAFSTRRKQRFEAMLAYLQLHPEVRDVAVSGGDIANMPVEALEDFVVRLLEIEHIRSIRLASKSFVSLPQYFLDDSVILSMERLAAAAQRRQVDLALHTQVNHARQLTPEVAAATSRLLELGFRDVRNQGVLLRGVNATAEDLLELHEQLLYGVRISPYYLYVCDMIPNAEHWRTSVREAQALQQSLMGKLPGFAIPRVICDVPLFGKRLIDQYSSYDQERGISLWRSETHLAENDPSVDCSYFDPIDTLPEAGQEWWQGQIDSAEISSTFASRS
jgi:lysine 2,3-aminomutase